jgi:hypothetical protein
MQRLSAMAILLAIGLIGLLPRAASAQLGYWQQDLSPEEFKRLVDEWETDRDAFTPSTRTVLPRQTLVEWSYSYIDNRHGFDTHSLPETLVRFGITPRLELRLGWNYEVGGGGNVVSANEGSEGLDGLTLARESRMLYGLKYELSRQRGWVPHSSLIAEAFTPTSGEVTSTQPAATYVFGWELPKSWRLDAAMRYSTGNVLGDSFNHWGPSVVLRMPLNERWQLHAEYFGVFTQGEEMRASRAFFSPGGHVMLTPNLELGLRMGWGISADAANYFTNVGFGWRF